MSQNLSAPRWGARAILAGALAFAMTVLAAIGLLSRADAAFTTAKCAGPNITGRGASFARDAQKVFNFNFKHNYCVGTPGQDTIDINYEALGSGEGRKSMKVRGDEPRFGASDEPPSEFETEQMNKGTLGDPAEDTVESDNGHIHVIPAAVGAVAALVNFPNGCDPANLPAGAKTSTEAALIRVRFTKEQFEKVWAKDPAFDTWDEVFPSLHEAGCEDVPIIRVVRFDESGTTYAFKDYLSKLNGARGWTTTYAFGTNQTKEWPGAVYGPRADCSGTPNGPGSEADATDHLTSGCSNGNGSLVAKLIETDGSVGYSDVSTARNASPSLAVNPAGGDNDTYWTQVQNGSDEFTEPTADPNGYRTDGTKGANCQATKFTGIPGGADPTFGSWSNASGVNSPVGYGICTLTYGLVFDDNAAVWGVSAEEEAKAKTVKDYWENIVSEGAQGQLFGNDYSPLPPEIAAISRAAVKAIGWNKAADAEREAREREEQEKKKVTPPVEVAQISNKITLLKKTISSRNGSAKISVKLPGAGKLDVLGTAKAGKRKVTVGHTVLNAGRAGTYSINLKPRGAAKRMLKKKGKLRVSLKLTFTPNGGTAKTSTSSLTLKLKKHGKRHHKRHGSRH